MRQIDWDKKLSDDDIAWLRQAGSIRSEDQIVQHQAQFDAEVPDPEIPEDTLTQSVIDPNSRATVPAETGDGPTLVDPTQEDPPGDDNDTDDDYDQWTVKELSDQISARNAIEGRSTDVEVTGTGKNGAVTKADYIKGLRLWDSENVGVL